MSDWIFTTSRVENLRQKQTLKAKVEAVRAKCKLISSFSLSSPKTQRMCNREESKSSAKPKILLHCIALGNFGLQHKIHLLNETLPNVRVAK